MKKKLAFCALALVLVACDDASTTSDPSNDQCVASTTSNSLQIVHKMTQRMSSTDNIESIRAWESHRAFAVASKSRTVYSVDYDGNQISTDRLFDIPEGDEDEELTNSAPIGTTDLALTHTLLTRTHNAITACGGELILYDGATKTQHAVTVGPMPDSVAVSPDKKYAITADERDSEADAWGKCPVADAIPSVSVVDLSQGYASAALVKQIQFSKNSVGQPREPEYVAIASDSDSVAVTLQDSHEVALFKLSEIMQESAAILDENNAKVKIVALPTNAAGKSPWPDGITAFNANGKIHYAMAGEWNDTLIIIDENGNLEANIEITEQQVPTSFPCSDNVEDGNPRYSPDSITTFTQGERVYIAATLRFAGAVIIYDVTIPTCPQFALITAVGESDNTGCTKDGSLVYPEGISAKDGQIWVANEGESSITVIEYSAK